MLVGVALPLPVEKLFSYYASYALQEGDVVLVPFGKRYLWGVVWRLNMEPLAARISIKSIIEKHPVIYFSQGFRTFIEHCAQYAVVPLGMVLKMCLPTVDYKQFYPYRSVESGTIHSAQTWQILKKLQKRIFFSHCLSGKFHAASGYERDSNFSVISTLKLSAIQEKAYQHLCAQNNRPSLLQGVTGSGKTEVLLALSTRIWTAQKQVLIMLPEIMLAPQWIDRIKRYSDVPCAIWHSDLSAKKKMTMLEDIVTGKALCIVGARSALFLPYAALGMIVVDEEHDTGYKQEEGVVYHARDMAVLRGWYEKFPVIMASATPSMDTLFHVHNKKYGHARLTQRYGDAVLPAIYTIDMRIHKVKGQWISPPLRAVLEKTYASQEQSLLFLNRRGYGIFALCGRCGYRSQCADCATWLAVHKPLKLVCHYCGFCTPMPDSCPQCHAQKSLYSMGPGVERIAEEVQSLLPEARITIMSSDHPADETMLRTIQEGKSDIIVGTQIASKGHHFPLLTCVGVIDTDYAFSSIDFRATERLFQTLSQVAGRAGREQKKGNVFIQTLIPDDPRWAACHTHDWDTFIEEEKRIRETAGMPPFSRITLVTLKGRCMFSVESEAQRLWDNRPSGGLCILGPAPAPLNPLKGYYRWRFLVRAERAFHCDTILKNWIALVPVQNGVSIHVDRDPLTFL